MKRNVTVTSNSAVCVSSCQSTYKQKQLLLSECQKDNIVINLTNLIQVSVHQVYAIACCSLSLILIPLLFICQLSFRHKVGYKLSVLKV